MSWVIKDGDQSVAHDLDINKYKGKDIRHPFNGPWLSTCEVEIVDTPYLDGRVDCPICRPPQEVRRGTGKLPRHKCPLPECGAEHIIGKDV